jgi:hypothetical protein
VRDACRRQGGACEGKGKTELHDAVPHTTGRIHRPRPFYI